MLDVLTVQLEIHRPEAFQSENHVIDDAHHWERQRRASWDELLPAIESPGPLWVNEFSSFYGHNDRVPESHTQSIVRSLYLIRSDAIELIVGREGGLYGPTRRRVRAQFTLNEQSYRVAVTDPVIERAYLAKEDGAYPLQDALLTVSLGEIYHGYAYKLAAAVLTPERAQQ